MTRAPEPRQCVVVGKTNVGKTLFAIRFSEYLGARSILLRRDGAGSGEPQQAYTPGGARRVLVSADPHWTLDLQSLSLDLRAGKARRRITLIDTPGLGDHIDQRGDVRRGMAAALRALYRADLVIHMIDASRVADPGAIEAPGEIDQQIARFARFKPGYAILANKMDLEPAAAGLRLLRERFPGEYIIPVSALEASGFPEVKAFVRRHL